MTKPNEVTEEDIKILFGIIDGFSYRQSTLEDAKNNLSKLSEYYQASRTEWVSEEIIRIRDLADSQIELNTCNYDDEDVLKLNDEAIDIYFALNELVKKICLPPSKGE